MWHREDPAWWWKISTVSHRRWDAVGTRYFLATMTSVPPSRADQSVPRSMPISGPGRSRQSCLIASTSVITGRRNIAAQHVFARGKAWHITLEDDREERALA